jgi:4-amino-4-deoxy-L-arabinose transferase-like glycosyltransferase
MAINVFESFQAVYEWFERPCIARRAIAALLLIQTVLLAYSGYIHSPTLNEPAHLAAGLSHWKFGRFDLYSVNPPLVRMIASLPVLAVPHHEDWSAFYEGPGTRPEMALGEAFVRANGERSLFLFMLARWACIPLSWVGLIVCYLWSRDLYGRPAGVLAATIWCFEPNILAHSSLITPDAYAAALGLAAVYTFWRWLKKPTWTRATLAGVVLGCAVLSKSTLIILCPLWPFMWLIYHFPDRRRISARDWLRTAAMNVFQLLVALYILNLGYGFEGSFTKLKDFQFVSDLFTRGASAPPQPNSISIPAGKEAATFNDTYSGPRNPFNGSWIADIPAPVPMNFLLGIDAQQRDFEHYYRPSYLRGEWRATGWWFYYFYAAAIKVPLAIWLLAALTAGIFLASPEFSPRSATTLRRDELVLILPGIIIFAVASSKSGFSEHMRYVLPAFAFLFLALSQIARIFKKPDQQVAEQRKRTHSFMAKAAAGLIVWLVTSSLCVYPHSLSYFNEAIGGPRHGAEHLLGSNLDWGQDLLYLRNWCRQHPDVKTIDLVYHGAFDPKDIGIECLRSRQRQSVAGREDSATINENFCAISATLLYGATAPARRGNGETEGLSQNRIANLRSKTPKFYFGYSIYCFNPD